VPWLLFVLVPALAVAGLSGLLSLPEVAVGAFAVQLLTAYQIARVRDRILSISAGFAALWVTYFPLRLLVIAVGGTSPYDFPAVRTASPQQLVTACELTTAALFLFLVGQWFINWAFHPKRSVDRVPVGRRLYLAAGLIGISVTAALTFLHVSSGILSNVGDLTLFSIAGLTYLEARAGRTSPVTLALILAASYCGYLNGFKLLMLMPVAAWVIGRTGAGARLRARYVIVVIVATAVAFGIIQGERDATQYGHPESNPVATLRSGLGNYDLAHGVPADYQGVGIVGNLINGVLFRLNGADYYLSISSQVPSRVPYQHGRSLWQPALSILPGMKGFLYLAPQYRQLNLMEYVDQALVSVTPPEHPVAQSMTPPGDLYLNFGIAGVVVGMLILGALYGLFDRGFNVNGPVSAGVVAFAGLPLLELDPNLAYTLVTCLIRLGICAILLNWVLGMRHRRHPGTRAEREGTACSA
jgi:hypothetical protein